MRQRSVKKLFFTRGNFYYCYCIEDPCHSQQLLSCPMSAMSATSHRASAKTKWGVFTLQSSLWGRKKTAWDILYTRFIIHGSQHEKGGHHFIVP